MASLVLRYYDPAVALVEKVINGAFATSASWTFGTGWAHDAGNLEADHTAGNTAALEQNVTAVAGEGYQVVFTVKNRTAGTVTPQVGGVSGSAVSTNSTSTQTIRATGTGNLKFIPTTDFDGSIDDASVKTIMSQLILTTQLRSIMGLNDPDGGEIFGVQHNYINGGIDEEIAGFWRDPTIRFVTTTHAERVAVLYWRLDPDREIDFTDGSWAETGLTVALKDFKFSNEWMDGVKLVKSYELTLRENAIRQSFPTGA